MLYTISLILCVSNSGASTYANFKNDFFDPTRPLEESLKKFDKDEKKLILQAIFNHNSSREKRAIISGRTLKIGQKLSGWRLISITRTGVTLSRGDKKRFIKIRKNISWTKN